MKCKRVRAGYYRTLDGRYAIVRDPSLEYRPCWWVYDEENMPELVEPLTAFKSGEYVPVGGEPLNLCDPVLGLWEAKIWLEKYLETAPTEAEPPEKCLGNQDQASLANADCSQIPKDSPTQTTVGEEE